MITKDGFGNTHEMVTSNSHILDLRLNGRILPQGANIYETFKDAEKAMYKRMLGDVLFAMHRKDKRASVLRDYTHLNGKQLHEVDVKEIKSAWDLIEWGSDANFNYITQIVEYKIKEVDTEVVNMEIHFIK